MGTRSGNIPKDSIKERIKEGQSCNLIFLHLSWYCLVTIMQWITIRYLFGIPFNVEQQSYVFISRSTCFASTWVMTAPLNVPTFYVLVCLFLNYNDQYLHTFVNVALKKPDIFEIFVHGIILLSICWHF